MVRHCANFTVTFAYLTTQELYVTFACLIHHSSHRFRTQSLVTLRHSNIGLQPQCVSTLFVLCCQYFSLLLRRLCSGIHSAILMACLQVAAPLCGALYDLWCMPACQHCLAFCNQACLALLTATPVHSRPPSVHSLTHSLTALSPLFHVDLSLPARTVQPVISSGAPVVYTPYLAAAPVAARHAAYCQLFSIPISLRLYNRHFRFLDPFLNHKFSARRYCHYIMHHYFLFPVYYDDREIIFFRGESCCIAYRINCILCSL